MGDNSRLQGSSWGVHSYTGAADYSTSTTYGGCGVRISADQTVTLCNTADSTCNGVIIGCNADATNLQVAVQEHGWCLAKAQAAIAINAEVACGTTGAFLTANATNSYIIGRARTTASTTGDLFELVINPYARGTIATS